MSVSILPSGEELKVTPDEMLRYLNPDGVRQLLRQERLRWNLKPNKDADYFDNTTLFKYSGELHNEALYQRMEIRTFPDNNAYPGYAGINVDSGMFGLTHDVDKWDKALSEESINHIVNRTTIGAMATIPEKSGYGLEDDETMSTKSDNRMAGIVFDPYDGRAYYLSNDDPNYVNNETRQNSIKIPDRTIARIGDIPTRVTQLINDYDFVADPDYRHTDNNFTNSNRYILDNMDDRTFVYPEVAKMKDGTYIENLRMGLAGDYSYNESDNPNFVGNTQTDDYGDRVGAASSSYGQNSDFSGLHPANGYLPGIFKSYEELCKVDLVGQKMTSLNNEGAVGAKRTTNYYIFDGKWSPNWFDRYQYNDSYLAQSLIPNNMEIVIDGYEPTPYSKLSQTNETPFKRGDLYQWRYNRVTLKYYSKDIVINIEESGQQYQVGDKLRWSFGDDVFIYVVKTVGPDGQIQKGEYYSEKERIFEQDPSSHGVGLTFSNMSSVGHDAKLSISCKATIECNATQLKNNLYAYVDITPTVRSDNTTLWSDKDEVDDQNGKIFIRSTAAGPAYSGINSGRGGPASSSANTTTYYEHGGNATAGVHVHLFRYVINTIEPTWTIENDVQVFTGKWVDQGPLGLERPCDIKALLFSNQDTNNFNNYYKFMLDAMFDTVNRSPDGVVTNNKNAVSQAYIHIDQVDPESDQKFTESRFDPDTSEYSEYDITNRVLYINAATGIMFVYNDGYKNDPTFGYGLRPPGWTVVAGATTR
jgi:hypothetical protein